MWGVQKYRSHAEWMLSVQKSIVWIKCLGAHHKFETVWGGSKISSWPAHSHLQKWNSPLLEERNIDFVLWHAKQFQTFEFSVLQRTRTESRNYPLDTGIYLKHGMHTECTEYEEKRHLYHGTCRITQLFTPTDNMELVWNPSSSSQTTQNHKIVIMERVRRARVYYINKHKLLKTSEPLFVMLYNRSNTVKQHLYSQS